MGHEAPQLLPEVHEPVLAGMTLEIELGYFGEDEVYHIEDLVLITADGGEILTDWRSTESMIPISV